MSVAQRPRARVRRYRPPARPEMRLFCFPYAGGGVSVFQTWPDLLPSVIDVCTVELPGRDTLIAQPPLSRLLPLVDCVQAVVEPMMDIPVVFFGHSMGALLAFELSRSLRRANSPLPRALFVSGHRAPQIPDRRRPLHGLPEGEFVAELRRLEGTPSEVLDNRELMELFLPLLRADFAVSEAYEHLPEEPLDIPILAFGGVRDVEVAPVEVAAWSEQTRAEFRLQLLPGGHFFVHTDAPLLLRFLDQELGRLLARDHRSGGSLA